jgi:hypothetical protein
LKNRRQKMSKTNKLARECILLAMEEVKKCIEQTAMEDELLKYSECIKILSEAYKNIK